MLILLVLGVRSCQSSAQKRGLRDYGVNLSNVVRSSDEKVSKPLFRLLSGAGAGAGNGVQLQSQVNDLKVEADSQLNRAQALDVPGDMDDAQRFALLALELRRDGVQKIAEQIQPAIRGADGQEAIRRVAGQMRAFDASDVLWSQRVIPLVNRALKDHGINPADNALATTAFLPDSGWLDPTFVAEKLGSATAGATTSRRPAPGTHGHQLLSTASGSTALSTSATNQIPASPAPVFTVKVQNQGDNDERNARVRVSIVGSGPRIVVTKVIPLSRKGQQSTVEVPLGRRPPTGRPVRVTVEILPVPGEKKIDNNRQTYPVTFAG